MKIIKESKKLVKKVLSWMTLPRKMKVVQIPAFKTIMGTKPESFYVRQLMDVPVADNLVVDFLTQHKGSVIKFEFGRNKGAGRAYKKACRKIQRYGLMLLYNTKGELVDMKLPTSNLSLSDGKKVKDGLTEVLFKLEAASPGTLRGKATYLVQADLLDEYNDLHIKASSGGVRKNDNKVTNKQRQNNLVRKCLGHPAHRQTATKAKIVGILCRRFSAIEECPDANDGEYYAHEKLFRRELTDLGLFGVGNILETAIQERYLRCCKGVLHIKDTLFFEAMQEMAEKIVVFDTPVLTKEQQKMVEQSFDAKDGTLYIIGGKKMEVIVDTDAMKIVPDFTTEWRQGFSIINFPKKSQAYSLFQLWDKFVNAVGPDKFLEWFIPFQRAMIEQEVNEALNINPHITAQSSYDGEVIKALAPAFAETDPAIRKRQIAHLVNKLNNLIQRGRWAIPGSYTLLVAGDPAAKFGSRVIPERCVYAPGLAVGEKFWGIKPPAVSLDEIDEYTNLSKDELIAITDADEKLSAKAKESISNTIRNAKDNVIYFPAYSKVAETHAGFDKDGDLIIMFLSKFFPKEFVAKLRKMLGRVVVNKVGTAKDGLVDNEIASAVCDTIDNKNLEVGQAVNLMRIFFAMKFLKHEELLQILEVEGIKEDNMKLMPDITDNKVVFNDTRLAKLGRFIKQGFKFSYDNIQRVLNAVILSGRPVTEGIIDSTKTGADIEIPWLLKKTTVSGVQTQRIIKGEDGFYEAEVHNFDNSMVTIETSSGSKKEVFGINDYSGRAIKDGIEYATELINNYLENLPSYTEKDKKILIPESMEDDKFDYIMHSIVQLKLVYNNIVADAAVAMDEAGTQTEVSAIKKRTKLRCSYLASTIRELCYANELSEKEMVQMVKLAALLGKDNELREYGGSMFTETTIHEEYTKFVVDNYGQCEWIGSRVIENATSIIDSEVISFTKGVSVDRGIILADKITGNYIMIEYDDDVYAVKHYSEAIQSPAPGGYLLLKVSNASAKYFDCIDKRKVYTVADGIHIVRNNEVKFRLDLNRTSKEGLAIVNFLKGRKVKMSADPVWLEKDGRKYLYVVLQLRQSATIGEEKIVEEYYEDIFSDDEGLEAF